MTNSRMGGIAAVGVGLLGGAFVVLTLLASPEAYQAGIISWPYVLSDYALGLSGLFGLAAVPAISERVMSLSPGWVRWMQHVAVLGFALLAILSFWQSEYEMLTDDLSASAPAISISPGSDLPYEPAANTLVDVFLSRAAHGWIEVAGVGLWILTVSWLALQSGRFSAPLAGTGIASGFLLVCTSVGANLDEPTLQVLGTLGGLAVTPVWFIWSGFTLFRADTIDLSPTMVVAGAVELPYAESRQERLPDTAIRARRKQHLIRLWPN